MIASFFLDLLFGVDKRLRDRQLDIERQRLQLIAEARARLLEELRADESRKG